MIASAWWRRRRDAAARQPRLASALLDRRYLRYALHRLRGFALARGAAAALWVLESAVLLEVLRPPAALATLLAGHVSTLLGGAWWGATELQRMAVRDARDRNAADAVSSQWLRWALWLAVAALAVGGGLALHWRRRPIAAAYAAVLAMRVAADLPLRVWHARLSAHRRIHRVMWLQLAMEATGPAVVLALHRSITSWGFFAAMAVSSVASRGATYHFVRRAYAAAMQPWLRPARRLHALAWSRAASWAVAGVATRIPNVFGLVLLASRDLPITVAIAFHMTVGALTAASGWSWSHYQDLFAVDDPVFARLRARLERLVMAEAVVVGGIVALAVVAIVHLWAPRAIALGEGAALISPEALFDPRPYALGLPAIALGLAVLAGAQVIAWTRRALWAVTATGVAAAVAVRCAEPAVQALTHVRWTIIDTLPAATVRTGHIAIGAALAACGLVAWALGRRRRPSLPRLPWLVARRRAEAEPARVHVLRVAAAGRFADALEDRLARAGASWWSRRQRSWLVAGLAPEAIRALALECAGLVVELRPYAHGAAAPDPPRRGLAFRFDRRGPRHPELGDRELDQIWGALRQKLHVGQPDRRVAIADIEIADGAVVAMTARFRSTGEPASEPPGALAVAGGGVVK